MITKDMIMAQVIEKNEALIPVLFEHGLFCIGCIMAHGETIEQAAMAHGIDCDALVKALNEANDAPAPAETEA